MKNKFLIITIAILIIAISSVAQVTGTFTDVRDGKVYKTVKLGTQTWMSENLNYESSKPSWCYNDSTKYCNTYGRLYTFVSAKDACPIGWHLPSKNEWEKLINYLDQNMISLTITNQGESGQVTLVGSLSNSGGCMKESGTLHWKKPNIGATNKSGFTGLPAGSRNYDNTYAYMGEKSMWWSSTEDSNYWAWFCLLDHGTSEVALSFLDKTEGYSVRCVKNE